MSIKVKTTGNFKNTETFLLEHKKSLFTEKQIFQIADQALKLFKDNTPSSSGKTAESWSYEVKIINGEYVIEMHNSNIQNGYNIALLVDEGHALQSGAYVAGKHYIDRTIKEIFRYIDNMK